MVDLVSSTLFSAKLRKKWPQRVDYNINQFDRILNGNLFLQLEKPETVKRLEKACKKIKLKGGGGF